MFLPSPMPGATGWKLFPLNDPSWSLFFELDRNPGAGGLLAATGNRNLALLCLVAGGVLAMSVLNLGYAAEGFRWPGMLMGLLRVGYSFFAGVLIYRFRDRIRPGLHPLIALGLVAAALLGAPPDRWRAIYDLAWILVGFPAVIALAAAREPTAGAGAFRFLGVTSYGVYVLHYPLQRLIQPRCDGARLGRRGLRALGRPGLYLRGDDALLVARPHLRPAAAPPAHRVAARVAPADGRHGRALDSQRLGLLPRHGRACPGHPCV